MLHFLTFLAKFMVETKLISPELYSLRKQLSLDILFEVQLCLVAFLVSEVV